MSLTNPNKPVTEARLQEFYHRIKSYLGFTKMPSEDMSDVISPLPSIQPRYHKYSTEEHIVGEWIDGRPIYEKVVESTIPNSSGASSTVDTITDLASLNVDTMVKCEGISKTSEVSTITPYFSSSSKEILFVQVFFTNSTKKLYVRNKGMTNENGKTVYVTLQYIKSE